MVVVDMPARMVCAEKGCTASEPVDLCVTITGGFAFRPQRESAKGWQVTAESKPGAPFTCFCDAHKKTVSPIIKQVGPAGPRLMVGEPH